MTVAREDRDKYFTVVFEGDVSKLPFNPFLHEGEWGKAIAIAVGDLIEEADALREKRAE